jgi:hypothetical protein
MQTEAQVALELASSSLERSNPTLQEMLKALAVVPGHQALLVCDLFRDGVDKGPTLTAMIEVRLISTTNKEGNQSFWNVAAGEYEGQQPAGKC